MVLLTVLTLGMETERFWAKVDRRSADECWPWLRAQSSTGYGVVRTGGTTTSAHRVAWAIVNNQGVESGMVVDHLCGVRLCCNPAHLELVTQTENVRRSRRYRAGVGEVVDILGRVTLRPRGDRVMAIWRERLETGKVRQRGKTFASEAEALDWVGYVSTHGAI
jgi:hypothetical protein